VCYAPSEHGWRWFDESPRPPPRTHVGPEPHPGFIGLFSEAPLGDGYGAVAGAGEDGQGGARLATRPRSRWSGSGTLKWAAAEPKTVCRPLASAQKGALGVRPTRSAVGRRGLEAESGRPVPYPAKYRPAAHCRTRTRARGRSIVNPAAFIAPSVRRPPTMRNMLRSRSSNFRAFLKAATAIS
jgi:hypothetical protein